MERAGRKVSCRQCREAEHAPLRCEELAVRMRLLNYVEAKMTDALLRTCPNVRCGRRFVKSDGCNKMVRPRSSFLFVVFFFSFRGSRTATTGEWASRPSPFCFVTFLCAKGRKIFLTEWKTANTRRSL